MLYIAELKVLRELRIKKLTFLIDKNSIIIPEQNKFVDPSQWSENLKCYVCDRVFDKTQGILTHHW